MKVTMHVCKGCEGNNDYGTDAHRVAICGHVGKTENVEWVEIGGGRKTPAHQRCGADSFLELFPNDAADRCKECEAHLAR